MALVRFDLDLRPGEFVTLLGPSGCGKSTVLRLIAALTEPTLGTVAWSGRADHGSAHDRQIGFVFQEPTLMPWATVARNVSLPFDLRGAGRRGRAARGRGDPAGRARGFRTLPIRANSPAA